MIHRTFLMCFLIASALAFGQDQKVEPHSRYRLEFVLKQLDHGKVLSTHNFVMSAESNGSTSQVRTGNRIPIDLGGEKGLQYQDVGFSCDEMCIRDRPNPCTMTRVPSRDRLNFLSAWSAVIITPRPVASRRPRDPPMFKGLPVTTAFTVIRMCME